MGKRKSDYESILKKLKKLERKLAKKRRLLTSSGSESESEHENSPSYQDDSHNEVVCLEEPTEPMEPTTVEEPVIQPETDTHEHEDSNPPLLEPEILQLLGEDPLNQTSHGENLHIDIASRWTNILKNGLRKEDQIELVKRYPMPENCPNMRPPKLNLEIKAALSDINIKQDIFSQSKQTQLASSLSAIGKVLNWTLESKSIVPQEIIKTLSDAGRLICDSHHRESMARRFFTLNSLNKNIRDTIKNTKIDDHLFGSNLTDHIKSSKAITRAGSELRPQPRPIYRMPPTAQLQRGALNSRGAPRAAAAEPRSTPAPRRPPRDRRQEATRGRRFTGHTRQQPRKR